MRNIQRKIGEGITAPENPGGRPPHVLVSHKSLIASKIYILSLELAKNRAMARNNVSSVLKNEPK